MAAAGGDDRAGRRIGSAEGYRDGRIQGLTFDLAAPRAGERLLDIGCRDGGLLRLFHRKGCDVTGIDPAEAALEAARQRLGQHADLHLGRPEDLPFSDNEFDLVTLVAALEQTADPGRAVAEAVRVCRGRLFIGILNPLSLIGLEGKLLTLFRVPAREGIRFLNLSRLSAMIRSQLPGVRIQWGSVLFLPWGWYASRAGLEERLPVMNNPFGAFLGLSTSVNFTYQTLQEVIAKPMALGADTAGTLSEIVSRRWTHEP